MLAIPEIKITPTGSADLTFQMVNNFRDNPQLDANKRSVTNFGFDENIQVSMNAKIGDLFDFDINWNTQATFDFENKIKLKYDGKEDDILQLFDVFVSSSLKEGMPYTLIEAMASGVPIVATDVVGNRDVVIDGITGRLVAAKNPDAIYEGLQKTVSNRTEAEKFAMNGISYVKKEFTVDKSVERLFGIYQALAGDRP